VGWYNGLPENRHLSINFENKRRAIIIGQGNVALDITRLLLSPIEVLEKTDISPYALEALKKSNISEVVICGRRGPLQASFTIKELRELVNLKNVRAVSDINDFHGIDEGFLKGTEHTKQPILRL
jgi:adrenodoxin-NADP+ reductase